MKQRLGLKGTRALEAGVEAFYNGKGIKDFAQKKQRAYLKRVQQKNIGKTIRVLGDYLYIFGNDHQCITVWQLPDYFAKKNVYAGKILLRNPAKYMRNYHAYQDADCTLDWSAAA